MVQRDQWDTYWGLQKLIFLIRDIDDLTMAAASVNSCRFVARRSPGGRIGSVLDVRKRLHRVRHPFHQSIHIKQGAWQCAALKAKSSKFSIQSYLESPKRQRMRCRAATV